MPRKVFIATLGSSDYRECQYCSRKADYQSQKVRFIQEATLEMIEAKNWSVTDTAYILVTDGLKGSQNCNWIDNGHIDRNTGAILPREGLKSRLEKLALPFPVIPVLIEEGNSEEEIWKVFETVYHLLEENDEIYFDITHGFRYLPMLILVLTNYSKLIKNIKVKHISYGNWEAKNEMGFAPVIDLTSFSNLQDWTQATTIFLKTGITGPIVNLAEDPEIESLDIFTKEIYECRGLSILRGTSAMKSKTVLNNILNNNPAFKALNKKICNKLEKYEDNSVNNGFAAVQFCIDHSLVQQGFTLLQEFIVTKVLLDIGVSKIDERFSRDIVNSCLIINDATTFNFHEKWATSQKIKAHEIIQKVFDLNYKEKLTKKVFQRISQEDRNDINHAGKRKDPKPVGFFMKELESSFADTKRLFNL